MATALVQLMGLLLVLTTLVACDTPPNIAVFEDLPTHMGKNPKTGHIEIRPSPACEEAINEPACGHGIYIMTKDEVYVGEEKAHWFKGKPWSQLKAESVYVPAKESYAPLSSFIINQCEKNHCSDQVDRFKVRMDELKNIGALVKDAAAK